MLPEQKVIWNRGLWNNTMSTGVRLGYTDSVSPGEPAFDVELFYEIQMILLVHI